MSGYRYPVKSPRDCLDTTLIPPDFSALFFGISGETVPGNRWRLRRIHGAESPRRVGASWETSVRLWKRGNWTQTCKKYFCGFCSISSPFSITHARLSIKEIQEYMGKVWCRIRFAVRMQIRESETKTSQFGLARPGFWILTECIQKKPANKNLLFPKLA